MINFVLNSRRPGNYYSFYSFYSFLLEIRIFRARILVCLFSFDWRARRLADAEQADRSYSHAFIKNQNITKS